MWDTITNEPLKSLIIWATVFSASAFYMQRLHHEQPDLWGVSIPGPQLMAMTSHICGWIVLLSTGYVWYRLGWIAAILYIVIPFAIGLVLMLLEMTLLRVSKTALALGSTPIALLTFGVLMWKLAYL